MKYVIAFIVIVGGVYAYIYVRSNQLSPAVTDTDKTDTTTTTPIVEGGTKTGGEGDIEGSGSGGILPYDSGVAGMVLLGPICPVERIPPDPKCADKGYQTNIEVLRKGSNSKFAEIMSDTDGSYVIMLPPGDYILRPVTGKVMPSCSESAVTIRPGIVALQDLSCDSGIR